MIDLKRSDKQYVEVEEFSDYELTQCIAYEMAARGNGDINITKEVVKYYKNYKEEIDRIILQRQGNEIEIFPKGGEHIMHLLTLVNSLELINLEDTAINYKDPKFGEEFWEFIAIWDKFHEMTINEDVSFVKNNDDEEIEVSKNTVREGYIIHTSLLSYEDDVCNHYGKEDYNISSIEGYRRYIEENPWNSATPDMEITEYFKRPKIEEDELKTISPKLTLNLNKPLDELIAYVTHVKTDMEQNNLVKLPIELLGIELKKSDTKISKKKLADKFFVYDYVKARLKQIEELNSETEKVFKDDEEQIKSNPYSNGADRTTQINMLKKDLRENLINTSINDIFEEEELTSSIPKGTAKRYYYEIKPYIEGKKYKELITGILT